ncbi:carboxypeptidase regulatory-like domain-containing protein [Mucilaginibacter mali]|uniref:Carboxypeptidase regulatory-like domain-containing protein n=1 Tax=Mucilaginibacter mali TaxID=2740462 RepID=A0A7D4QL29_9SPHI|nr:carboxypeptidase regulatory-like domain-containing protein [Mucilaginibacter mali]QKJ30950.1 carboxypeptidase regulatory-like domain-containing protein [Mucilaginibacter mali]
MKSKYLIPAAIIFLFACSGLRSAGQVKQGIEGYVYLLRGNQMPSPGKPISKGRGVARDIYIYQPTSTGQTTGNRPAFTSIKTKLIAQVKSDSAGHYFVKLPPGDYSVFIKEGACFFAAESDGSGTLNPVKVNTNIVTLKNLTITLNATY